MNRIFADDGNFYCNIYGRAEGTSYSIVYQDEEDRDFQPEIENLLKKFEKSLSVYDETSIISRINRNEDVEIDEYFRTLFTKAAEISRLTEGVFDISAEPLFRAWGFSSEGKTNLDQDSIVELKQYIGMDKVRIEGNKVRKDNPNIVLNANAIAKGYSADIVADFLDEKACKHYLVEIGGEIRSKGRNPEGELWRIGIDKPSDDNPLPGQHLQAILQLSDKAVATSGNYRQFTMEKGQRINHTINPVTGYPVESELASVTIVADDALTADALATAAMVAGVETTIQWSEKYQNFEAIFILNQKGIYQTYCTRNISPYLYLMDDED